MTGVQTCALPISNDALYNGYYTDAAGNHQKLLINTMVWLAQGAVATTGIKNYSESQTSIALYPNPSNSAITVLTNEIITSAEIISYTGQKIKTEINNSKIDISALNNGCYVLQLITPKGIATKTFIKTN